MNDKRKLIKTLGGSVSTLAFFGHSSWSKPVVNWVLLPAHAQTSTVFGLDSVSNAVITPNTVPDDRSQGLIAWSSFNLAKISSSRIQEGARYSLLRVPDVLDSIDAPFSLEGSRVRLNVFSSGEPVESGIVRLYQERLASDINGTYEIVVQVTNLDGTRGRTVFKLKFSGF